MDVVFDKTQCAHSPELHLYAGKLMRCPDQASRATRLLAAAQSFGCELKAPRDFGLKPIAAIHDSAYLEFLQSAHSRWAGMEGASAEVVPHAYAVRGVRGRPKGVMGLAGLYMAGTNCPIGANTWRAAYASAQTAVEAAVLVESGERMTYALCRPPGHHAYADLAGGFCYLNNCAIAANRLLSKFGRVAIVDIDVHHGNGTQEIFYERGDVYFTSIHADPSNFFPFYAGYSEERGAGDGLGNNLNLPLAHGSGDSEVLAALGYSIASIQSFSPGALVISLGFDAFAGDPLGVFKVTTQGFERIGELLGKLDLPTVLVQEGGYDDDSLGENLVAFLTGIRRASDT